MLGESTPKNLWKYFKHSKKFINYLWLSFENNLQRSLNSTLWGYNFKWIRQLVILMENFDFFGIIYSLLTFLRLRSNILQGSLRSQISRNSWCQLFMLSVKINWGELYGTDYCTLQIQIFLGVRLETSMLSLL